MPLGKSREGLPINVQIVGKWHDEHVTLHIASLLEAVSSVKGSHPSL
ncbi:glutamyl-tRNA(Gln) amidotransferase [Pectobacterium versatile]|nr:glutamyl-tRNA(Gln) amidotransferase [Pectobacterium versatile]